MNELAEIESELLRLQERKREITADKIKAEIDYIKSLSWTKDCCAKLIVSPESGFGLFEYKIALGARKLPLHSSSSYVEVMGSDKIYSNNIQYYYKGCDNCCLLTNNVELLIEFLSKVKFKSLKYNKNLLKLFQAAELHQSRIDNGIN